MDKAHLYIGSRVMVQQGVEHIVAHKRSGGIGYRSGQARCPDGIFHLQNRHRGKVSRRPILRHKFPSGLIAGIVFDPRVTDVYADALRGHRASSARLSDAQHRVRLKPCRFPQHRFSGKAEDRGDLKFT